jgi:demethylspheroidene O-methyltransferase
MVSLRRRWMDWRNQRLSDPAFQRWAASLPLIRGFAARRARSLFDLCAGFVYSQVLLACVRLKLFDILAPGPQTVDELALQTEVPPPAMQRLLEAAAALRLVQEYPPGRYGLGVHGAALRANPGVIAMIEHHAILYSDLSDPVAMLCSERPTQTSRFWAYAKSASPSDLAPDQVHAYSTLMAASQHLVAGDLMDAYPLARHRCVLDVGGGDGSFLIAAAERVEPLRLMLFEVPSVAELARRRVAAAGLAPRADIFGGDWCVDALPRGADLITLIRVLHDHDDQQALALLRSAFAALPKGGALLIAEMMSGTRGGEVMAEAYFGMYLLAMRQGRPRSKSVLVQMVQEAGFVRVRNVASRRAFLVDAIVAERP